jgi:hypothetical protein
VPFYFILKTILKCLKHVKFKVHGMYPKVMWQCFIPHLCVCLIFIGGPWYSCPSKTSKCLLVREIPLGTSLLKKDSHYWKRKSIIHAFNCITILFWCVKLYVIIKVLEIRWNHITKGTTLGKKMYFVWVHFVLFWGYFFSFSILINI